MPSSSAGKKPPKKGFARFDASTTLHGGDDMDAPDDTMQSLDGIALGDDAVLAPGKSSSWSAAEAQEWFASVLDGRVRLRDCTLPRGVRPCLLGAFGGILFGLGVLMLLLVAAPVDLGRTLPATTSDWQPTASEREHASTVPAAVSAPPSGPLRPRAATRSTAVPSPPQPSALPESPPPSPPHALPSLPPPLPPSPSSSPPPAEPSATSLAQGSLAQGYVAALDAPTPPHIYSPSSPPHLNEVEEDVEGVGAWGGSCTCPDGQVYQVPPMLPLLSAVPTQCV